MTAQNDSLLEKWRRFYRRPPEDRSLILRAAILLPLTEIGLRAFGFQRWKELIEKFSLCTRIPREWTPELQREAAGRAARAVRSAELHGPSVPNCLERSMVLWWLLRRDGVEGELHIGARKEGERFKAHAWVELAGQVLNDGDDVHQHYARFDAPIAAAQESGPAAGKAASRAAGKAVSQ